MGVFDRPCVYIKERKECRKCYWFSTKLGWWDWLKIPVKMRKKVIGRCFRPRDNWQEYPVVESEKKRPCPHYKPIEKEER